MASAMNKRTGKVTDVPEHYIGHPVLGKDSITKVFGCSQRSRKASC